MRLTNPQRCLQIVYVLRNLCVFDQLLHRIQRHQQRAIRSHGHANPALLLSRSRLALCVGRFCQIQQRHRLQLWFALLQRFRLLLAHLLGSGLQFAGGQCECESILTRLLHERRNLLRRRLQHILHCLGRNRRSQLAQQRCELQLRKQRPARRHIRLLRPHRFRIELQRHLAVNRHQLLAQQHRLAVIL